MFKWHRRARRCTHITKAFSNRSTAGFALSVSAALLLTGNTASVWAEELARPTSTESSVLIATREVPANESVPKSPSVDVSQRDDSDSLQPVAQSSDNIPELAESKEVSSELKFGGGEPRASRKPKEEVVKSPAPTRKVSAQGFPAEPVKFQGMLVGQSSKQELLDAWGKPSESVATAEGTVLAFDIDPFQVVEVLIGEDDVVSAIKIALASPLEPKELAEQLALGDIRTVTAYDEDDLALGQAFPERGVIFMYQGSDFESLAGDGKAPLLVSHVVLQRLDPLAYVMRVEASLHGNYTQNITDLNTALKLDSDCAHAQYLLGKTYLATGQADQADDAANKACKLDPDNASYQLLRGQTQEMLGNFDEAVLTVRAVLDREYTPAIDKAQALHQMGCLASLGDVEIASKAIGFHTRAIEVADPLATSKNRKVRRAAKQLLVEAHMAIAEEVARQSFDQKVQTISLWIGRASGIAEDFIANDGGGVELRLHIAQRALASLASFRPTLDPTPWVREADDASKEMFAFCDDEMWQARVKWELGIAYLNALRVEHVRRETQNAINYGNKAVDYLAQGASTRQAVYSSEQLIGLLYFQLGAVQAVHQLDHVKAAQWYDKAEPLLTSPLPKSELYAPRREGEMLVSMGVTYWQVGEKNRALELTRKGVELVESAVQAGILAKSTLGVPYSNLATMYQKVGENSNAAKYAQLAQTIDSEKASQIGQLRDVQQTSAASQGNTPGNANRPRPMRQR